MTAIRHATWVGQCHYDRVNVLLVDNSTGIRDVREIFHLQGFRNIRLGATLRRCSSGSCGSTIDIMILGAHFDDGDVTDFGACVP